MRDAVDLALFMLADQYPERSFSTTDAGGALILRAEWPRYGKMLTASCLFDVKQAKSLMLGREVLACQIVQAIVYQMRITDE